MLERLLLAMDAPDPERAQLRWEEYRDGADSTDMARKAAADAGFTMLLAWYGGMLYRHIWGFVRSDAAEDVLQEVLRKLHENRRNPRLGSFHANVLPWLRQVAIRQCVDEHRRLVRRRARESRPMRREAIESRASPGEVEEMLSVALAQLTADQQQAIALHYFEGLNRQEAAAALGINRDTFAARLNAALGRLRKLISSPVAVALGGTTGLPAALAAHRPQLSAERLERITTNAWASASVTPGIVPQLAVVMVMALTLCGGAAAIWMLTRAAGDPQSPPVVKNSVESRSRAESLQDRNLRVAREDIAIPLKNLIQRFYSPDNPVRMTGLRAFGSELEFEFAPERPPPAVTGLAARLRGRYCTFRRRLIVEGQPHGEERWYSMNPERPFVIDLPVVLGLGGGEVVRGREEFAEALRLLDDRLPHDPRAEGELLRHLFGPPGGELLLPTGFRGVSGFPGGLVLVANNGSMFVRGSDDRWRYAGECPGWNPVVVGDRVYCTGHSVIRYRPLNEPAAPWVRECDEPPFREGEEGLQYVVANQTHIFACKGQAVWTRPVGFAVADANAKAKANAEWKRAKWPYSEGSVTVMGDRIYVASAGRLNLGSFVGGEITFRTNVGRTEPSCTDLVADRDRLLAFGGVGPIYARPITAGPNDPWTIVGRVQDPYKR